MALTNNLMAAAALTEEEKKRQQATAAGAKEPEKEGERTLQGAAENANAPATTSTPLTSTQLGASPDAAKMAGTPASLAAQVALPAATAPKPATLREADAAKSGTTIEQDRARIETERLAKSYGDTGIRLDALVAKATADATPVAAYVAPTDTAVAYPATATAEQRTAAQAALTALAADASNPQKITDAQRALQAAGVSGDPLSFLGKAAVGTTAAKGAADKVFLTPEVMAEAGIDATELQALGFDPAKAGEISVVDFQSRMREEMDRLDEADSLATMVNDPSVPLADRQAAQRQLAAIQPSAAAASAALTRAVDQALSGAEVEIDGKTYDLGDLLNDENFSTLAEQYVGSPEGSELRKQVDAALPSFSKFIKDNEAAIGAAATAAEGAQGEVKEAQGAVSTAVGALGASLGGMGEEEALGVIQEFNPEVKDTLSTAAIPKNNALFNALTGNNKNLTRPGTDVWADMQALKSVDPDAYAELKGLSQVQLNRTGILNNPGKFKAYLDTVKAAKKYSTLDDKGLLKYVLGGDGDPARIWAAAQGAALMGDRSYVDKMGHIFDKNKDGKPDKPADIASRLRDYVQGGKAAPSAKELLQNLKDNKPLSAKAPGATPQVGTAWKSAPPRVQASLADGVLTQTEVRQLPVDGSITPEMYDTLIKGADKSNKAGLSEKLNATMWRSTTRDIQNAVGQMPKSMSDLFGAVSGKKDPEMVPAPLLSSPADVEAARKALAELDTYKSNKYASPQAMKFLKDKLTASVAAYDTMKAIKEEPDTKKKQGLLDKLYKHYGAALSSTWKQVVAPVESVLKVPGLVGKGAVGVLQQGAGGVGKVVNNVAKAFGG